MQIDRASFFNLISTMDYVPFEQSEAWLMFKTDGNSDTRFLVDNSDHPSIACWGRIFNKPLVGPIFDIIGEVHNNDISQKQLTNFFESIIQENIGSLITFNSVSPYSCTFDIALRRAGFNRPLGNRVCPLTIVVDLQFERKPDRNWKRNLKKANDEGLVFHVVDNPTQSDAQTISSMFEELKEMKSLGYSLDADRLTSLLQDSHYHLCYVLRQGIPISARIIYIDHDRAADVFAANSFESRKYAATHFICEQIFEYLKGLGVSTFDFSRIPPSNNETDSVYLFKAASGGRPMQYNGEWYYAKNRITPLLFCIYNFYIRKSHQY